MENKNNEKQLPDVFNELQEIRRRQAMLKNRQYAKKNTKNNIIKKREKEKKVEEKFYYDMYQEYDETEVINHKFNAIGAIIGILFFILFITTVKSNYIFATSEEQEKTVIGSYEENKNPIDLMECVSENISEVLKKEIITESIMIERQIEYIEDDQLPRDEQIVLEEGRDEYREITYIRSYENEELIDEIVINDVLIQDSLKSVIRVGTSDFLANNKVHIGDTMYTKEKIAFMSEPDEDTEPIGNIYEYIDLTLQEVEDDWCKIVVDGIEGYVKSEYLTSAVVEPQIIEKNRIKRIALTLKWDMELNKPSGLLKEDFVKVLSGNRKDVNKIFEDNAEVFYNVEQKYNVNGIFLASIGIHESNWGTSNIANDKKNLFGYGAYDSSPYTSSVTFESYESGIELLAKILSKYYLNEQGTIIYDEEIAVASYYNGPTVSGVNVRYASDQNWANRVYQIMTELYEKLED